MHLTDIFIRRPVLAMVVSLIILLLGLRSAGELKVREYPVLQNAQVDIHVAYPGANPAQMEGFVTTPLEREIATADGIDFLYSSTFKNTMTISAFLRPDQDPDQAVTEISSKVNKIRGQLPPDAEDPIVEVVDADNTRPMYLSFWSDVLDPNQMTDYLIRQVEPELSAIDGVQRAEFFGGQTYAIRVWLRPDRLTAHGLTAGEVQQALREQNFLSAVGESKSSWTKIQLTAQTSIRNPEEFRQLVVKSDRNGVVRLGDVAEVELGADTYEQAAFWNGDPAIFIAIKPRPDANVLDTIDRVREVWPQIVERMPEGVYGKIGYDATQYIKRSISEVRATLAEAVTIVVVVIFLFLGSVRSALIPAVTVPLSLIGAMFLMYVFGFTINVLTLLAMVLAIGMVVDDAIIVLENIHRHVEEGMKPFDAAIKGARELVGPVIAMTITLVAVYLPIGFLSGLTGTLFTEFAFTLAGAVVISGVVALTLTPMMCARIIKPTHGEGAEQNKLADWLDQKFESWRQAYKRRLHGALNTHHVIGLFGLIVLGSCVFLFQTMPRELVPAEDPGFFGVQLEADNSATLETTTHYMEQVYDVADEIPDIDRYFSFSGVFSPDPNTGFVGLMTDNWDTRERSLPEIIKDTTQRTASNPGLKVAVFQMPALPTPGKGFPVEFVLKSTRPLEQLAEVGDELIAKAMASKKFVFMSPELRVNLPTTVVDIDRDKAALLGIDMARIATDLGAALSGGEVNRFSLEGRSYKVLQQVTRADRLTPSQLGSYHTRSSDGSLVPLSALVTLRDEVQIRMRPHAQQLNANTLLGVPRPGVTLGDALDALDQIAAETLPPDVHVDYSGASRQFKQEGAAMIYTFAFALIVIYLVLAAQFESFVDPLIMLVTVPMSICGALMTLSFLGSTNTLQMTNVAGMTLNLYTQVGLLTLVGVITKHGILIVEFANKLQLGGMSKRQAIEEAASIRLRPVLMTTAALVVAMIPLILSSGPGASARQCMGWVIASGMTIGTLFTLYIVPTMYLYLGRDEAARAGAGQDESGAVLQT